jgi:methylated-DNA-[protein]-cysteine S-methyltransferase
MDTRIGYTEFSSPIGPLLAVAEGPLLRGLYMTGQKGAPSPNRDWQRADEAFVELRRQLQDYFAGRLRGFDLPLRLEGTPFQQRVWQELVRIPFGTTISYAQLAARIGKPGAARAVGHANGRNPISIIVPCHRVIGAGGDLTGYGGGLENKRWLLEFEREVADSGQTDYSVPLTASRLPSIAASSGRS